MALMRGNPYIYRNFEDKYVIHAGDDGSVTLPRDAVEEFAVMVVSALDATELQAAVGRVNDKHGGNFGASAVREGLGLPSAYDIVRETVSRLREEQP